MGKKEVEALRRQGIPSRNTVNAGKGEAEGAHFYWMGSDSRRFERGEPGRWIGWRWTVGNWDCRAGKGAMIRALSGEFEKRLYLPFGEEWGSRRACSATPRLPPYDIRLGRNPVGTWPHYSGYFCFGFSWTGRAGRINRFLSPF